MDWWIITVAVVLIFFFLSAPFWIDYAVQWWLGIKSPED